MPRQPAPEAPSDTKYRDRALDVLGEGQEMYTYNEVMTRLLDALCGDRSEGYHAFIDEALGECSDETATKIIDLLEYLRTGVKRVKRSKRRGASE